MRRRAPSREIIQRVRPDILLLQEFDYDADGESLRAFRANYLARPQNGAAAHRLRATPSSPSRTPACPPGFDLDNDGKVGRRRRRAGLRRVSRASTRMALLSRFPDRRGAARARSANSCGATCRARCCRTIRDTGPRLVLARGAGGVAAVFEEPLGRAGDDRADSRCTCWPAIRRRPPSTARRIAMACATTTRSASGATTSSARRRYIRDDHGQARRIRRQAVRDHGRPELRSRGWRQPARRHRGAARAPARQCVVRAAERWRAPRPAAVQGGANAAQRGDPRFDTADFNDRVAGNLRVDYLLPSKGLHGVRRRRVLAGAGRAGGARWSGATARRRARITGWCGSTSLQTQLDAHRAVIRQPVRLRVLVVEHHAHERLLQHALREVAAQQDVVDVFAVFAVASCRA